MISGNIILHIVPETLDQTGERGPVTNKVVAPEEFMSEVVGQLENLAPLASDAVAADITAKLNALIAALKTAGYMKPDWIIANTFTHLTGSNTATVAPNGTEYSTTLSAEQGYALPEEITVVMGGVELETGYTYVSGTGVVTIASVEGDVEIVATAVPTHTVTQTLTGCTSSSDATVINDGDDFEAAYTASDSYILPDEITVIVGGDELTDGYTWDNETGGLIVENVTGDLFVTITATVSA